MDPHDRIDGQDGERTVSRFREHLPRLGAEFVIVFLSVVLALLADDWPTTRDDRAREREVLVLLLSDLEHDAGAMELFRERMAEDNPGDARLLTAIEDGVSADSLLLLVPDALQVWNHRPSHPTRDGLVQDVELGLIRDDELRGGSGLGTSPDAVLGDVETLNAIGDAGMSRQWLRTPVEEISFPENRELQERIRAWLAEG